MLNKAVPQGLQGPVHWEVQLLYPPPPLYKLRKSPKLIRSLRLL